MVIVQETSRGRWLELLPLKCGVGTFWPSLRRSTQPSWRPSEVSPRETHHYALSTAACLPGALSMTVFSHLMSAAPPACSDRQRVPIAAARRAQEFSKLGRASCRERV